MRLVESIRCAVTLVGALFTLADLASAQKVYTLRLEREVGTQDGGDYGLTRAAGAVVGPNGHLYLLQPLERTVRAFTPDGKFVRYVGREGEGPGEFRQPLWIGFVGDTLWVSDAALRRVSFFSAGGDPVGTLPTTIAVPGWPFAGATAHAVLARGGIVSMMSAPTQVLARGLVETVPVAHLDRTNGVVTKILDIDRRRSAFEIARGEGSRRWAVTGSQPFSGPPIHAVCPDGSHLVIVMATSSAGNRRGEARVLRIGGAGSVLADVVLRFPPVRLQRAAADSAMQDLEKRLVADTRRFGATPAEIGAALREVIDRPAYLSPIDGVLVGRGGEVWLRRNRFGTSVLYQEWYRFDSDLRPIGVLRAPAGLDLLAFDRTALWAIRHDQFDVPFLGRYSIVGS
jgi:hypothetical protein